MPDVAARKLQEYSRTNDQTSRDALIMKHLWLVRHLMGRIAARLPSSVDVENLEAAGMFGLVEAADRFDSTRGVSFKSFATLRIRGAIIDEARRNCVLPQEVMARVSKVMKAREESQGQATVDQLANMTGFTVDQVLDALMAIPLIQVRSLDQIEDDPTGQWNLEFDAACDREEQKRLLTEAITQLPERERLAITLYYKEGLRLKEIGKLLEVSESYASRRLTKAEQLLREFVRAQRKSDNE
jgi:RNA polymerase sigma factor FliA